MEDLVRALPSGTLTPMSLGRKGVVTRRWVEDQDLGPQSKVTTRGRQSPHKGPDI